VNKIYGLLSRGPLGPLGQQRSPREALTLPQNPRQAPFSMSALGCAEEEVDKHSCKLQTQKTDLKKAPQSKSKQVRRQLEDSQDLCDYINKDLDIQQIAGRRP